MRKRFIYLAKPKLGKAEILEVVHTLKSGWLTSGPKVIKFEGLFKDYIGCDYALAVNSGTAALHLSLVASGIKNGDEVITSPMTFAATANVIVQSGAILVFADIDRETMNIDPAQIRPKITPKTKAIIPVHFAGRPCDMKEILRIKDKYGLLIIEDAAHAIEAEYEGRKIGNIGDLTAFSFYATKNMTTGEGGMITTNNQEYAEKIDILRLQGMSKGAWKRYAERSYKHYEVILPGYKYNMSDIQAAIGIHQLKQIEKNLRRRQEIWHRYDDAFAGLPVITPQRQNKNTKHSRHIYTLLIEIEKLKVSRDKFQEELSRESIGTGIHYIALHLHEYYRKRFGYKKGDFPNAECISERTISLPLSAGMTDREVDYVINAVRRVIKNKDIIKE